MRCRPCAVRCATIPHGTSASRRAKTGGSRPIALNRPERKNPLTFDSYAELRDLFRDLAHGSDVRAIVLTGAGGNFSSGGDVFEIIEPLTRMATPDLLAFTRMTGDVVKAMRKCPQPIIAAVDGVCAGAGAILAMASDLRLATPEAKTAFLFTRVGLAGADMGACGILPRIIGQGRAAELLYTGRTMSAAEGSAWGFYNALHPSADLEREALALARSLADGPWFAHGMTKTMLNQEWAMGLDELIEVGSAGADHLHDHARLPARFRGLRRQAQACLRGRLMNVASRAPQMKRDWLDWPFFGESHRAFAGALDRFVASGAIAAIDHERHRRIVPQARAGARRSGSARRSGRPSRRRRLRNRLAERLSCARDARLSRRARRFRLRHAGPRLRRRRDRGFRRAAQARAA